MTNSLRPVYTVLTSLLIVISLTGCKKDTVSAPVETDNHTISIINGGSNTSTVTPKQFTYMVVTPTDLSSSPLTYSFVSNPNTTVPVKINIPKTGFYKLQIYVAQGGQSIWWNSLALAVNGTTPVTLMTNNVGYADNSYAVGIRSSGNDIR
jgi:hypothetical protein